MESHENGGDSIARIASKLIHEIKNPLNAIYMNLQLLEEEWKDETGAKQTRLKKKIALLKNESQRLHEILDDFLRFARSSVVVETAEHNLSAVTDEVVDFIRPEVMARGIRLFTTFSPVAPMVLIDRKLFKQAILNILINAQDALEKSGDIIIKTFTEGNCAFLDISDTGAGIPAGKTEKIFEPFYSTKSNGSGLGLPATKKIIDAHNGEITVQSVAGKGTNFRIKLPLEGAEK